jgi:acyl-CoA thioester hydrolase
MDPVYRFEIRVSEAMLDGNRHVNNVAFVQWMQEAAMRHSEAAGCTRATVERGATWFVRAHHIEYLSPAFDGDTVLAQTWVANFRKIRSLRRYKFIRASDQVVLAQGETDWVFVDARTGRPRAIPGEIQDLFQIVPDETGPPQER